MDFHRQRKGYGIYILSILIIFFVVSCGRSARQDRQIAKVTPLPSGEPQVAYGASLSEWEEATGGNTGQQASSNNDERSGEAQLVSPLAYPAPVSPLAEPTEPASEIGIPFTLDNLVYRQILWDGLIPANFTADAIMAKYEDELARTADGSPEATELYKKMQVEFNSAPVNEKINETLIRLPGFIAPLEYTDDRITEFLLVPYFGACIHVPPPPANQTVLVSTAEGEGISPEDSNNPIWVMGKLTTEGTTTQLAAAGYHIEEAIIEPYMYTQ
ncbi:MAG: DUF3299 domain-containing protein [Chloroflexota bacterium]